MNFGNMLKIEAICRTYQYINIWGTVPAISCYTNLVKWTLKKQAPMLK